MDAIDAFQRSLAPPVQQFVAEYWWVLALVAVLTLSIALSRRDQTGAPGSFSDGDGDCGDGGGD